MFLIPLGIFVNTKNAEAHTITISPNVFFHLWQQDTYINFASTTDLDSIIQTSDKLYLNQYWFNVENANLTISKFFTDYQLVFIVNAPSGTTSTINVYVDEWGEPTSVYTNGTITWNFDPSTNITAFVVSHTSSVEIAVDWGILGDINRDGDVDFDDLAAFAGSYGSFSGEPAYNADADLDHDGDIDLNDLIVLARNYGKTMDSKSLIQQSIPLVTMSIALIAFVGITGLRLRSSVRCRKA
jgi:hypothetical protein